MSLFKKIVYLYCKEENFFNFHWVQRNKNSMQDALYSYFTAITTTTTIIIIMKFAKVFN